MVEQGVVSLESWATDINWPMVEQYTALRYN